ncbi:MAG TPA: hypothetical protein DCX27_19680 [Balneola sp.]|nr:hypothetical protein [Balneola sp.]
MNSIPVVGWILSFIAVSSTAVPFWIAWTRCGIGEKYFYFLPEVYLHPGFWDCVGVFMCVFILKKVLTPKFASVTNTNSSDSK